MLAKGMLGRLMLARVPGVGWAPAAVSSGKSQVSGRNPRAKHPGTVCGAKGLGEREQPLGPCMPRGGFKQRRSWDGGEKASGLRMRKRVPSGDGDPLGPPSWSTAQWGQRPGGMGLLPSITHVPLSRMQAGAGGGRPPKRRKGVLFLGLGPLLSLLGVGNSTKGRGEENCNILPVGIA